MTMLHDLPREHGIRLTVTVFPHPNHVYHGDLDSIWVRFRSDWCSSQGIPFSDFFPLFDGGRSKQSKTEMIRRYFIVGDTHRDESGHRVIAERFLSDFEPSRLAP
jgi:hypothetical protein